MRVEAWQRVHSYELNADDVMRLKLQGYDLTSVIEQGHDATAIANILNVERLEGAQTECRLVWT